MKAISPSSLRARLLVFVLIAMIPAMGFEVTTSLQQRRQAATEASGQALRLASLASVTQRDLLEEMNQFLATLALLPSIQQADADACDETLSNLLDLHPYTSNLGLIDRQGYLLCSALPFTPPVYGGDRAYFQRALERREFATGDYQIGRVTGIPTINVGYPVAGPTGEIRGVVFAAIDLTWVDLLATEADLPEGSTMTIVDPEGIVLARYPDSTAWVSRSISDTPLYAEVIKQPGEGTAEMAGIDGANRLYGYTPLLEDQGEKSYLIVGIPTRVVFREINRALARNMIGWMLITIAGLVAAWVGSEFYFVREVKKLVKAAHRLASGELEERADPGSATSELGELALAFNDMAESLQARVEDLEGAEARLERINRSLSVLTASNQAVVRSEDEETILSKICTSLVEVGGYCSAWIGFLDQDKGSRLRLVSQRGFQDSEILSVAIAQSELEQGKGPTEKALRTRKPVLAYDIPHSTANTAWIEEATRYGYHSFVILPIEGEDQTLLGILTVYAREERGFDEEELALLEELTSDLSYGIISMRSETERKQALEEVHRLKEFNEGIIQTITEGIFIEDEQGRFSFVNPAAASILGYDPEELIGLPYTAVIPPDQLEHLQRMNARRREGIADQYELELIRKDGSRLISLVSATPQYAAGRFTGSLVAIADVTELRNQERKAQLQERLAVVGGLAAGIAHDFNNMLSAIILYSQLVLQRASLPDDDQRRIETIGHQAMRGAYLVSQILDFSRKAIVERRPWDLSQSLLELKPLLEHTLPENINIRYEYPEADYIVNADPTRMQQIIMNLALNARDAMPEGGELRFELQRMQVQPGKSPFMDMADGEWVQLIVTDTGCGIPQEVLPHIFEPFFTTKSVGKGTGLGLAQVYGIVKQHDGYIDVVSQKGKGTSFSIYLPFHEGTPVEIEESAGNERIDGAGRTILVVEDESAIREAAAEILRSLNFQVLEASSGKDAIDIIAEERQAVDLILSDLVMPDMGGRELQKILRQGYPEVRIVLITGYPMGEATKELLEQQDVTWMNKPFGYEDLIRVVRRALR